MGNLGGYQVLTTQAKALGGPAQLVAHIGQGAIARVAPGLITVGVLVGAGATVGVQRLIAWRREVIARGEKSGEDLVAILEDEMAAEDAEGDDKEPPALN